MFKKMLNFFKDVHLEMKKVSWSSRKELINSTWVVIISVAIFTILIGIFDIIFSSAIHLVVR